MCQTSRRYARPGSGGQLFKGPVVPPLHLPRPDRYTRRAQTDRRALNITLNSIGTELTRDDRKKLYSNFGLLYPHGHNELAMAEDFDQIRSAMEKVPAYSGIFSKVRMCACACACALEGWQARLS